MRGFGVWLCVSESSFVEMDCRHLFCLMEARTDSGAVVRTIYEVLLVSLRRHTFSLCRASHLTRLSAAQLNTVLDDYECVPCTSSEVS